jgi:hypothetical protein
MAGLSHLGGAAVFLFHPVTMTVIVLVLGVMLGYTIRYVWAHLGEDAED